MKQLSIETQLAMLDVLVKIAAAGHDINCDHLNDKRLRCTCHVGPARAAIARARKEMGGDDG